MPKQKLEPFLSREISAELFATLSTPTVHILRRKIASQFGLAMVSVTLIVIVLSAIVSGNGLAPLQAPEVIRFFPHVSSLALLLGVCFFPKKPAFFATLAFLPGFAIGMWIELAGSGAQLPIFASEAQFVLTALAFNMLSGLAAGILARRIFLRSEQISTSLSPDAVLVAAVFALSAIIGGVGVYWVTYFEFTVLSGGSAELAHTEAMIAVFRNMRGALIAGGLTAMLVLPKPSRSDILPMLSLVAGFAALAFMQRYVLGAEAELLVIAFALLCRLISSLSVALPASMIGLMLNSVLLAKHLPPTTAEFMINTGALVFLLISDLLRMQKAQKINVYNQNIDRLVKSNEVSRIGFLLYFPQSRRMVLDSTAKVILALGEDQSVGALLTRLACQDRYAVMKALQLSDGEQVEVNALLKPGAFTGPPTMVRLHFSTETGWDGRSIVFASVVDVTTQFQVQKRLSEALDELRADKALQRLLLETISHEMRSPASVIHLLAERLQENPAETEEIAPRMHRLSAHLLAIMEEARAALRNGVVEQLREDEAEIAPFFKSLRDDYAVMGNLENTELRLTMKIDQGLRMSTNTVRLRQILGNLLRNAFLHAQATKIEIKVSLIDGKGPAPKLNILVEDNGVGIPQALLPHIFESFSREKVGVFSKSEGTGLGMHVVKTFLERMNGDIEVRSTEGTGTVFEINLPIRLPQSQTPADAIANSPELEALKEVSVLLVEDSDMLAELTAARLRRLGMKVQTVPTAEGAIVATNINPPEIVITDEHLPGRSGTELLKTLRENGYEGTVFALTGNMGEDFEEKFLAAGGDGIMIKPFNRAGLLTCLKSAKRSATVR